MSDSGWEGQSVNRPDGKDHLCILFLLEDRQASLLLLPLWRQEVTALALMHTVMSVSLSVIFIPSDLSLTCRRICTQHSAENPPTLGPLSQTRASCSLSPESSDWSIWSCSWCQTLEHPETQHEEHKSYTIISWFSSLNDVCIYIFCVVHNLNQSLFS